MCTRDIFYHVCVCVCVDVCVFIICILLALWRMLDLMASHHRFDSTSSPDRGHPTPRRYIATLKARRPLFDYAPQVEVLRDFCLAWSGNEYASAPHCIDPARCDDRRAGKTLWKGVREFWRALSVGMMTAR